MTIYDLKKNFQNILRPMTKKLAAIGVTANQVTICALLFSIACGAFIYLSSGRPVSLLLVPLVLFVRMALNAIDGMLAREHSMMTNLGALLNELGDVVSDTALYLPLAVVSGISAPPLVLAVVLAIMSEMTGVISVQIGATRRYDGPMGKSDRAFVFSCLALLLGCGVPAGVWSTVLLWLVVLSLVVTIINRSRHAVYEAGVVRTGGRG